MQIGYRSQTDPFFNIAAEEYFIKNAAEDMCMVWVNDPAVIIGKHQNPYSETNYPFLKQHNIPVIRRISGGGAVYHDTGNINFTFIQHFPPTQLPKFNIFTSIIEKYFNNIDISITLGKRNSLFIEDKKFSGHAEHVFKNKVLHHGTILFNTDLEVLNRSITSPYMLQTKALSSVRSAVTNIKPYLPKGTTIEMFISDLISFMFRYFEGAKEFSLTEYQTVEIQKLADEKYKIWEWNFGYSPKYHLITVIHSNYSTYALNIEINNGVISNILYNNTIENISLLSLLEKTKGLKHKKEEIADFIDQRATEINNMGINATEFLHAFFPSETK